MNDRMAHFLQSKGIDSFQKLNFLLFLYRHPKTKGTSQEFAERMYFGDMVLLEKIITDLQLAGLVEQIESRYKLCEEPIVKTNLRDLATTFEDPFMRQELINRISWVGWMGSKRRAEDEITLPIG